MLSHPNIGDEGKSTGTHEMRSLASFIMRGPAQATLVAVGTGVLALMLPPLSLVSGAAIALTTLRSGPKSGLIVALGSTAFVAILAWLSLGSILPGLLFLGVMWLPLWVLSWVLRETRSLAMTMLVAGILGVLGILAVYLMLGDTSAWWEEMLLTLTEPAMQTGSPLDAGEVEQAMATLSKVMTGIVASGMVLNALLCLFLARGWQALLYNPGGFRSEFHELRLGRVAALVALGVIVLSMLPLGGFSSAATEIMIVALSLFIIQGFAMVHAIVASRNMHVAWLVGLYLVSMFVLPQLLVLVALLGLIDTWADLRRRFGAQQGAQ